MCHECESTEQKSDIMIESLDIPSSKGKWLKYKICLHAKCQQEDFMIPDAS